jgi:hypothetical protein
MGAKVLIFIFLKNNFKKTQVLKFRDEFNLVKEYFVSYKFL